MTFSDIYFNGFFMCKFKDAIVENPIYFVLLYIATALVAYLMGSLNCSVLLSRIYGKDVRKEGSGNAGATNMTRVFGKKAGALTFLGDLAKASLALFVGRMIFGLRGAFVAGIFGVLGHAYPLYFGFKGGKGVVCMLALGLFTTPDVLLILLVIFAILLFGFKMVSFASVMTMVIYPFVLYQVKGPNEGVIYAIIASLLVIFLHRQNLVRIFNNTESKISFGKKK